jgi:membrane-bound ClpP family serine protease
MSDYRSFLSFGRGCIAACIVSAIALTVAPSAPAADIKISDGTVVKVDAGNSVRVLLTASASALAVNPTKPAAAPSASVVEGKILRVNADDKSITVTAMVAGKPTDRVIKWSSIKSISIVGSSAAADSKTGTAIAAAPPAKRTIFIMPWEGTVGEGARHDEIEAIGKEADKIGPHQIIILEVISPGGLVTEGDEIDATLMDLKKRHRVIAWIKEAISAAAFTSLHCDEIYFQRVGTLGAITMFAGTKSIEGAELDAWQKKVGDVTEVGGRNRWVGEAMVTNAPLLSYDRDENGNIKWYNTLEGKYPLSDAIQNLTLNADIAMHCKFADGIANNPDELIALLHLNKEDVVISPVGYKIHKDWQALLEDCKEQKPKIIRDAMNPAGSDNVAQIGSQIKAIKQLILWWDKCAPCMQLDGPQVPPKEELEKQLKQLRKQLGEIQKQKKG